MTSTAAAHFPSHHRQSTISLGMAQLAPKGLSEDWWLKNLGDVHWQLIADAVGQNTTVFRDVQGRQLYAAFCATEFQQFKPDMVGLGKELEVRSELWAAGRSRIQSTHRLIVQGVEVAQFKLVSTFVAHMEKGINASVRRATPYLIPVLEVAPDAFARQASADAKENKATAIFEMDAVSLPTHVGIDFNAVGLLYFPSFTRLLEQTEIATSSEFTWSPVRYRKVLYFGNIELGGAVLGSDAKGKPGIFSLWNAAYPFTSNGPLASCSVKRF